MFSRTTQYRVEVLEWGNNYFLKVGIGNSHFLLVRAQRRRHEDVWDFHSLQYNASGGVLWAQDDALKFS